MLTQGITHIAPAMSLVVTVQFVITLAGTASPLAYLIAFLIVLALVVCLAQLALHLPSAGGYYIYVARSLKPKAGFLAAWMFFLYDPLTCAVNLAYLGFLLQTTLRIEAHITCPWYVPYVIFTLVISLLIYRGIQISAAFVMWLTIVEAIALQLQASCIPAMDESRCRISFPCIPSGRRVSISPLSSRSSPSPALRPLLLWRKTVEVFAFCPLPHWLPPRALNSSCFPTRAAAA